MAGISSKAADGIENKYKYNGKEQEKKEFSDGSGLDWYDYGARYYDINTIDPHTENYYAQSGYDYVGNNPILRIDPDGWTGMIMLKKQMTE